MHPGLASDVSPPWASKTPAEKALQTLCPSHSVALATLSGFLEGYLHNTIPTPLVFHVAQQAKHSYQNRYFRDSLFIPPKYTPHSIKIVTEDRKKSSSRRRQEKYQMKCLPSSIHGKKKSPEVHCPYLNQGQIQAGMTSWCLSKPSSIHIEI